MNNLRITTTDARIGIKSTSGYYTMNSSKGNQTITTTKPKMTISGEPKKAIIDSYECWAERGLKNNIDLLREGAQLGKQAALSSIARKVADGNRMANITKHAPRAIPDIVANNSKRPMHEFNFGLTPTSRPNITITGGQSIDWQLGTTNINYTPSKPEITYTRGKVETYLQQKNDINIEWIDTRG